MKKFYTLLAGLFVAGSAMAAIQPIGLDKHYEATRTIDASALQMGYHGNMTITMNEAPDGMTRMVVDPSTQKEYSMLIRMYGEAGAGLGLGHRADPNDPNSEFIYATFEEFPCYVVLMLQQNLSQATNEKRTLLYYVMWPCKAMTVEECMDQETGDIDWNKAAELCGGMDKAKAPLTIKEFRESALWRNPDREPLFPVLDGFYGIPYIIHETQLMQPGRTMWVWDGNGVISKACTLNNDMSLNYNNCSYLVWQSYDPDLTELTVENNVVAGPTDTQGNLTSVTVNTALTLSGVPTYMGMASQEMQMGEVHIYNCGLTSIDTYWGINYDNEFDEVNRYFVAWTNPTMVFFGTNQNGEEMKSWTKTEPGSQPCLITDPNYDFSFFNAALFTAPDATYDGLWSMPEPDVEFNEKSEIVGWNSVPEPYKLVYHAEYVVGEQDGFWGVWGTYYLSPTPGVAFIGVNDKELGFNFSASAEGWGSNRIYGSQPDKLYYHSNPNDFDVMEQVSALGTGEYNALNAGSTTAVEVVESNAPVVSTQYFNLQGQRLNVAPEHGVFIQRDIKADGTSKAMKVAK